jgi:1,4-dihydroxy-2-naphthoate octaprenyltransferase
MARPFILLAGVLAHGLGSAIAFYTLGRLSALRYALSLGLLLVATAMAHYADEYADQDTDALTHRTRYSGGSGVLPAGIVPAWSALTAALTCGLLALGLTLWWVWAGWLPRAVVPIVGVGLAGGWIYSMPPVALERRGLGEIDNALLGGQLMPLIGYAAQTGIAPPETLLALLPATLAVLANLLGVHWSDREADAAVGRRSLVVILGEAWTRRLYRLLIVVLMASILAMAETVLPLEVVAASLCTAPVAAWGAVRFGRGRTPWLDSAVMTTLMVAQTAGWLWARISG